VSVSNNVMAIGASGCSAALAFERPPEGQWAEVGELVVTDGGGWGSLGHSISVSGQTVLAGTHSVGALQGNAFVFDLPSNNACPSDVTGDGVVDSYDILEAIDAWGPCSGCEADTNGDEVVDVVDLLAILTAWGSC
jgi:hypothetical protein